MIDSCSLTDNSCPDSGFLLKGFIVCLILWILMIRATVKYGRTGNKNREKDQF